MVVKQLEICIHDYVMKSMSLGQRSGDPVFQYRPFYLQSRHAEYFHVSGDCVQGSGPNYMRIIFKISLQWELDSFSVGKLDGQSWLLPELNAAIVSHPVEIVVHQLEIEGE